MSISDISKMLLYNFWHDYLKQKYGDRAKLRYMDTHSFIIQIITEDIFEDISNDVEKWFVPLTKLKMFKDLFQQEKKRDQIF